MNTELKQLSDDYLRIEQAILYLENHFKDQPGIAELAATLGLSESHFQRIFTRWAGVSPKRFLQFLTKESAKDRDAKGGSRGRRSSWAQPDCGTHPLSPRDS